MKIITSLIIYFLSAVCSAELRTWTAINGKEVAAEFVSNEKGIVKLKLKSGKVFEVPLNKLSKLDQEFLKAKPSSGPLVDNIVGKVMNFEFEGGEILVHFNGDGRKLAGENGGLEDGGETYKIEGNEVLFFVDGKRNSGISFSSSSPKVGDQIEWGGKEGKITTVEAEIKLSVKNDSGHIIHLKYLSKVDAATLVSCDKKASGKLVIPATIEGKPITSIGRGAFQRCENLTGITIPEGVTNIGDGAFAGCNNLTSITIPDSVTSIGGGTFSGCNNLTSITIPNGVTSIGDNAFQECSRLTSITIPDSVTSIGGGAFGLCTSLNSITIPDGVTSIAVSYTHLRAHET